MNVKPKPWKLGAGLWTLAAVGAAFVGIVPLVAADGDCNPPESPTTADQATYCGDLVADLVVGALLGGQGAQQTTKSCSGITGTCTFTCDQGDWIKAGAAGPPGGSVSGSCGGVTAACTIILTACGDQKGPTNSAGSGTCTAIATTSYTCGAGPKTT